MDFTSDALFFLIQVISSHSHKYPNESYRRVNTPVFDNLQVNNVRKFKKPLCDREGSRRNQLNCYLKWGHEMGS